MLTNLTSKGEKIFKSMKKQYGVKKAMEVFTAMEQEGKLKDTRVEVQKKRSKK